MSEHRPHPGGPYFEEVAERLGSAYLRYDFTKGSAQEVTFLVELLDLPPEARLLDVGCGPGRHAVPLAEAGYAVVGIDVSRPFLDLAAEAARRAGVGAGFFQVDARQMPFDDEFDAVVSICQGAFGLMGKDDALILRRMREAVKPGGRVIVTAFSAYHAARYQTDAHLDAEEGIVHEDTTVRDPTGAEHPVEVWTSVYTPRELRLLAIGVGLIPEHVWSVSPGDFARRRPDVDHHEFMLVARRPGRDD